MKTVKLVLSAEDIATHIAGHGLTCPFCGGEFPQGQAFDVEEDIATQPLSCCYCFAHWNEIWKRDTIEILSLPTVTEVTEDANEGLDFSPGAAKAWLEERYLDDGTEK